MKELRQHNKNRINFLIISGLSLILLCSVYLFCQIFLEKNAYDFFTKLSLNQKASKDVITVVIDDKSIAQIGRWPWKRAYYADIFEYLETYGNAKAIAFDSVMISQGKKGEDDLFFKRFSKFKKVIPGIFFSKQEKFFANDDETQLQTILEKKFSINIDDKRPFKKIKETEYLSSSYSFKEILNSAVKVGSVLSLPDNDGIIRKSEPIFYYKGKYYPSLALAVYMEATGDKNFQIKDGYITSSKLKMPILTSKQATFTYIKWYKPINKHEIISHQSYSAWEIIKSLEQIKKGEKPLISPEEFKNKIIVVGATATTLKDIKLTPISKDYPGVDIQATIIDNILNNNFIYKPSILEKIILTTAILALIILPIIYLNPIHSSIISILVLLGYFHTSYIAYTKNIALDVITPEALILCILTIGYGIKYYNEINKKKNIQKLMEKYISKDVMNSVLDNIEEVKLGGKRAEVTVLFADIRDFTSLSETIDPEEVSSLLNLYFSEIIPIIFKHNGMLNKFMGDAFLAIFGTPVENSNHAELAVKCAYEVLQKVEEIKQKCEKENKPKIEIGIGINTGVVFAGNIGSEDRFEYTVIGDTVNTANRIEAFNKLCNTKLLISSSTYEKVKSLVEAIRIRSVPIKGKAEPIDIFEIIKFKDE